MVAMAIAASSAALAATPALRATGGFFALSVPDAEASARWYQEKLGLSRVVQNPKENKVAVVILEGGGLIVELIQNDDAKPLKTALPDLKDDLLIHGVFKAGVIVADFDKTLATLKERGVEIAYGPYPAKDRIRAKLIVRDNAGNLIQFFGK